MTDTLQNDNEYFQTDVTDKVAVIYLREKGFEIITELEPCEMFISTLAAIGEDEEIVGLVLIKDQTYQENAAVKAFLGQMYGKGELSEVEFSNRLSRFVNIGERLTKAIEKFPKPLVAGIQTTITHEFLALVLPFDFRFASRSAVSVFPNLKMGVPPSGNLVYQFQRYVGHGKTTEILLSGEPVLADQLFNLGFVSQLIDDENLLEECIATIGRLSALPPHALTATLKTLRSNMDDYTHFMESAKKGHRHLLAHLRTKAGY